MSGRQVFARLTEDAQLRDIPLLFSSTDRWLVQDHGDMLARSRTALLTKPFDVPRFLHQLHDVLRDGSGRDDDTAAALAARDAPPVEQQTGS